MVSQTYLNVLVLATLLLFVTTSNSLKKPKTVSKGFRSAGFTSYMSYAPCCADNPNYDPKADTEECDDYSACEYSGGFAAIGHKDFSWVQNNSIVAFYDDSDPEGKNFAKNYGGKKIMLKKNGKTHIALIADTCGNDGCDGCCSANSIGGFLVDVEYWTAIRFFGSLDKVDGPIEFQIVS